MSRDERRKIQEAFIQDKDVLILVATDAAGEGINLQRAHLMINYDLPWNPNRIEQRFGSVVDGHADQPATAGSSPAASSSSASTPRGPLTPPDGRLTSTFVPPSARRWPSWRP